MKRGSAGERNTLISLEEARARDFSDGTGDTQRNSTNVLPTQERRRLLLTF